MNFSFPNTASTFCNLWTGIICRYRAGAGCAIRESRRAFVQRVAKQTPRRGVTVMRLPKLHTSASQRGATAAAAACR